MKKLNLILVVLILIHYVGGDTDGCNVYNNCYDCLNNNPACGWCGSLGKCMTGNETGPTLQECKNTFDPSLEQWLYTTSKITYSNTGTIVSPTLVNVFLRPGIPVTVPITVRVPFVPPIDYFFLCDASFSMYRYISTVSGALNEITSALQQLMTQGGNPTNSTVVFGMSSFLEKPIGPFGNFPEAWIYRVEQPLTHDTSLTQAALLKLTGNLARNYEHPEDSLEAMMHTALDNTVGWRPGSFHITMMISDASAHVAGDGARLGIYTPNNLDSVLDGWPPGTGEDYPSLDDVKKVLIANDVNPIFGVADPKVYDFYRSIVNYWNFGAVVSVTANASLVIDNILAGTAEVLSKAVLGLQKDDLLRVQSIDPDGGIYTHVQRNTILQFNVTLEAPLANTQDFGKASTIILRYVGFSTLVTINTVMNFECIGCSPLDNSSVVDLCGVCGGNNSLCVGCDGVVNSKASLDVCGVCGGKGDSCLGCDQKPHGEQWDVCGVCGGDNTTCVGCDGVPNSGLEINGCKQCGGPANCDSSLGTVIIALSAVAVVGFVFTAVALIFLCGASVSLSRADALMSAQEATLQENPLYEEAKKRFDNPLFSKTF